MKIELNNDELDIIKQALQEFAENCEQDSEHLDAAKISWALLEKFEV